MKRSSLCLVPVTLKEAFRFIRLHHRHHRPPVGGYFAVGVSRGGESVGVAVVGRPVARALCNGWTSEVSRVLCPGRPAQRLLNALRGLLAGPPGHGITAFGVLHPSTTVADRGQVE